MASEKLQNLGIYLARSILEQGGIKSALTFFRWSQIWVVLLRQGMGKGIVIPKRMKI